MADYKVTDAELISVANAIRTKGGTQELLEWPDGFIAAINALPGGGGSSIKDRLLETSYARLSDTSGDKAMSGNRWAQRSDGSPELIVANIAGATTGIYGCYAFISLENSIGQITSDKRAPRLLSTFDLGNHTFYVFCPDQSWWQGGVIFGTAKYNIGNETELHFTSDAFLVNASGSSTITIYGAKSSEFETILIDWAESAI